MSGVRRGCLSLLLAAVTASAGGATTALARDPKPLFAWPQELRLPWQAETRAPARRGKRRPRAEQQASPAWEAPPLPRPAPEPKIGAKLDPKLEAAAPVTPDTPPTTEPRAATRAIAEAWQAVEAQIPSPPPVPPLPPEGPGPAPANVLAFAAPLRQALAPPAAPARTAASPVQSGGVPLPPERPADLVRVALPPRAPLPAPPATPPPAVPPGATAQARDPECRQLIAEGVAVADPLPPIAGPGACGAYGGLAGRRRVSRQTGRG